MHLKKPELLFFIALVTLTWVVYLPTLDHELIWDSKVLIQGNRLLNENYPLSTPFKTSFWQLTDARYSGTNYYRPLLQLSFMLEKRVWGISPFKLRVVNLLIFTLALGFLYLFFKRQRIGSWLAEITILLFALFPINLDCITYVGTRADLLMLFWGILALLYFDRYLDSNRPLFFLLSSFFFLLALFSKETALFFLPLFFLYEYLKKGRLGLLIAGINASIALFFWLVKDAVTGRGSVPFALFPSFTENFTALFGSLGYYCRCLFFPFYYDIFLPMESVAKASYWILGLLCAAAIATFLWKTRHNKKKWMPLVFTLVFLAGHLLLIFTPIFPFSIYSRYLLVPLIGFSWMVGGWIQKLQKKGRLSVLAVLTILFIVSIQYNAANYRSEIQYWEKAYASTPQDSFIITTYAQQLFLNGNVIKAEILLNQALRLKMKPATALSLTLTMGWIEFRKANYPKCQYWLDNLEAIGPEWRQAPIVIDQKVKLWKALGKNLAAEEYLLNLLKTEQRDEWYKTLFNLYLATNQWQKAREIGRRLDDRYPGARREEQAAKSASDLERMSRAQKVDYYLRFQNYGEALHLLEDIKPRNLNDELGMVQMLYYAGREAEGRERIAQIIQHHQGDYRVLNTIGQFYLNHFQRLEEAVVFFRLSLHYNPHQPQLVEDLKSLYEWADRLKRSRGD